MVQGPKGYIAQMCEVHLQYGNSTSKMAVLHFFLVNSTLIYILYSLDFVLKVEIVECDPTFQGLLMKKNLQL